MANRTDKTAGTNLVEYILRQKIYDSLYWKQDCFGLTAERIVDKAVDLRFVGGMFGEPQKPTEFICLVLKMLQIQPDKEIILEFIKNDDFKYLRLLGAFYLRLVGKAVDVFNYLEPLLNDYRRVRVRDASGGFSLSHIDELVDQMLRNDYLFNIALPRLPARQALEKIGQLEPRVSILEEEFNEEVRKEEAEKAAAAAAMDVDEEGEVNGHGGDGHRRKKERWQLDREDDSRRDRDRRRIHSRSRSRSRDRRDRRRRSRSRSRERSKRRDRYYSSDEDDRRGRRGSGRDSRDRRRYRDRSPSASDDDDRRAGKRSRSGRDEEKKEERGGGNKDSLSVEETNKMRAKLGLPPLRL